MGEKVGSKNLSKIFQQEEVLKILKTQIPQNLESTQTTYS